jgi:alpha-mannosidase
MLSPKQIEQTLVKLRRFETALDRLIFEKVDEVSVMKFATPVQHHTVPEQRHFSPCSPGDRWGGEGTYCWFRGQYQVPKDYHGKTLYVYPKIGGSEGMLWVNGRPFGTFCSKHTVTDHGNHYCNMLTKNAAAGDTIDIAIEYYAGHHVLGTQPFETSGAKDYEFVFSSVDICLKNEAVSDFLFNLKTLNCLVEALDTNSYRRADVINTLLQVHSIVYYDYDNVDRNTFLSRIQEANELLIQKLKHKNSPSAPFAGLVGHSHMDTAWLWHIDETIKKCARTFSNQLNLMEQYPEYKFVQSSAYHGEMIREHYPDLFKDLQKRVSEGKYEPNGAVWVECDCNITSGESMIRQFLWGQRFTRKHFNYTSDTFWLPDTFGYSAAIPQIMQGCGVKYFLTTKIVWNDTTQFPYDTFYWKGLDGTAVLTHFNKTHIWPDPGTLMDFVVHGRKHNDTIKEKTVSNMRLLAYGFGDGGGGPQFEMIEMARRITDLEGIPRSSHTTVSDFMRKLEETLVNPSFFTGELYLELHRGTLTNQHTIKRNNRLAEIQLRNLEYVTVREAVQTGQIASDQKIRPLMNDLLVNQFHDILPGTCIPRVHDQSIAETTRVIERATELIDETLTYEKRKDTVSVLNTLPFERSDVIYLDCEEGYIVDGDYEQQVTTDLNGNRKLAVLGVTVPAFASVVLHLKKGELPAKGSRFRLEQNVLVTPNAQVTFDERGFITSFVDLNVQRELVGPGCPFNTFLLAEDVPAAWDSWDIDADLELKLEDRAELLERSVVSDGMVEFRVRSLYRLSEKTSLKQDMIFFANTPEVRFETVIDWNDKHRLLKTAFDTSILSDFVRQEIQFGYIKRPTTRNNAAEKAKFEVCNHKYTDLSEHRYGAAILNDCKYGISVQDSKMRLSLHKGGCRPDERGDQGVHECTYSFLPHNDSFGANSVIKPAYELNVKPIIIRGKLEADSFASVDRDNIIIETVKPCEDNEKAYIMRMYDAEGTYTRAVLSLGRDAKRVSLTNMLEETVEVLPAVNKVELEFKPFEIKTIKVEY